MSKASKPQRRVLTFQNLDDAVRDAEMLLAKGYTKAGNWDLGQCVHHVTEWLRYPMDGYPNPPAPIRMMLWMIRKTVGKSKLQGILATGKMPAGKPTVRETVGTPGANAEQALSKFREVVKRFEVFQGPFHPSPIFGQMTRDEWIRLNLAHAAHHLSFLVPNS